MADQSIERRDRFVLLLCFSFYGTFLFLEWKYKPWWGGFDFWEHAAVLRELSVHPFHPRHPVLDLGAAHAFFSPYLVALGSIAYYLNADYFSIIYLAGFVNAALFILGFFLLCKTFYPQSKSFVPIVGLGLSTFLWPPNFIPWSGFYQYNTIGLSLSNPSTFAFGISCILIYCAYAWRTEAKAWQALVIGVGTTVVILTHPTTALFLLTAMGAICVEALATLKRGAPLRPIIAIGTAVVLAIPLTLAWPYFSILALVTKADPDFDRQSLALYASFAEEPLGFVPFIVAAPFIVSGGLARFRHQPLDRLCVTFGSLCLIYIMGLVFDKMGVGRVLSQIHMLSCLFVADGLESLLFGRRARPLIGILASAMILMGVVLINRMNAEPLRLAWRALAGKEAPWSQLMFLQRYVGPDEIILVNTEIGNMVAAFAGRVIASDRPLHWVADAQQRRQAINSVLDANTPHEQRCRALATYQADFVLVTPKEKESLTALKNLGTTIYEDGNHSLIRVSAAASAPGTERRAKPKAYPSCEKS